MAAITSVEQDFREEDYPEEDFPDSWRCPISQELMRDPVTDNNGDSYERSKILEWLAVHNTSPLTRQPLSVEDLRPNRNLRDTITQHLQALHQARLAKVSGSSKTSSAAHTDAGDSSSTISEVVVQKRPNDATLEVSEAKEGWQMITVHPAEESPQTTSPVNVCLVIDVSGSMSTEARIQSQKGTVESNGLTMLDVVKHAAKTIIHSLKEQDRLAIVKYDGTAECVLDLRAMNPAGRTQADIAVKKLRPMGSTNLWDGLRTGLDVLRTASTAASSQLSSVFLLTDGCPNIVPPRGHLPMLRRYLDTNATFSCLINTFGFGYNLDSVLLDDIAREGGGSYSFIPDPGFVGTVFVNSLSNLKSTMGINAKLMIEPLEGSSLVTRQQTNSREPPAIGKRSKEILGGHTLSVASWGWEVKIGSLRYGQTKDIVVQTMRRGTEGQSAIRATLTYDHVGPGSIGAKRSFEAQSVIYPSNYRGQRFRDLEHNILRLGFVDAIYTAEEKYMSDRFASRALLSSLLQKYESHGILGQHKPAQDLLTDLRGQVMEAFGKDEYFKKWGTHYVRSLAGAHLEQQCTNFKDPGLQHYGGTLFQSIRDRIDDLFNNLPPPEPSIRQRHNSYGASQRPVTQRRMTTMRSYNCSSAPCFDGSCLVMLARGKGTKRVDQIRKGEVIISRKRGSEEAIEGRVRSIVKTIFKEGTAKLVTIPEAGLKVTPWHPIRINNSWCFPSDRADAKEEPCEAVYSFLLESEEHVSMNINGIECITLAHGIEGDPVASHPYFGSRAVANDIVAMRSDTNGCVVLQAGSCTQRDRTTGLVCKLIQTTSATGLNVISSHPNISFGVEQEKKFTQRKKNLEEDSYRSEFIQGRTYENDQ